MKERTDEEIEELLARYEGSQDPDHHSKGLVEAMGELLAARERVDIIKGMEKAHGGLDEMLAMRTENLKKLLRGRQVF